MRGARDFLGLTQPTVEQTNRGSVTVTPKGNTQTFASGWYPSLAVQGVAVQVATGSANATAGVTFYETGGTAVVLEPIVIPVPVGATAILFVVAYPAVGVWTTAAPAGWLDGTNAATVAYVQNEGTAVYYIEAGGALSLTTSSIVVPTVQTGSCHYTVYWI